jgi:hypothetical protein
MRIGGGSATGDAIIHSRWPSWCAVLFEKSDTEEDVAWSKVGEGAPRQTHDRTSYGWSTNSYKFTWSFEPYVEFVPYSSRVLGSKGRAVGWGIRPLPYPSLVCLLPIIGRPRPGTSTLDTLSARCVCRNLVQLALCGEHRNHF